MAQTVEWVMEETTSEVEVMSSVSIDRLILGRSN
jgi:hypothetical protein